MSLPDEIDCDDSECAHSQCWLFRRAAVKVADRERRRIRTAQKEALTTLWKLAPQISAPLQEVGPDKARASITVKLLFDVYYVLESSTRAPRAKRQGRKP